MKKHENEKEKNQSKECFISSSVFFKIWSFQTSRYTISKVTVQDDKKTIQIALQQSGIHMTLLLKDLHYPLSIFGCGI